MISRRQMLALAGAAPFWSALSGPALARGPARIISNPAPAGAYPRMGGTPTAFMQRSIASKGAFDMIEHCRGIGLGGVQMNPPSIDPEEIKKFRQRLGNYEMHLVCDPRLPRQESDLPAFESQVKSYKEAGAAAFHAAMTGRRYEDFNRLEPFKQMFEQCQRQVELAEPVLRRYKIKLGIENHKGWRSGEQVAWLKRLGSEWVGVCFDFGNNISLCEDPMDAARNLIPYACFAHIKDMAVEEYDDGFLLSEVPLGEGILDLKQMVQMLRAVDRNIIIDLEMITRDPLKITVFTDKYWATFDDSYSPLPGRDVAKVLALVKKNKPKSPLPRTSGLEREQLVKLEDEYNLKCIAFARQNLNL